LTTPAAPPVTVNPAKFQVLFVEFETGFSKMAGQTAYPEQDEVLPQLTSTRWAELPTEMVLVPENVTPCEIV
jgi:hypothetical protein